ncbi:MAG: hypothetical protein JWP74_2522 [Marmoricola sp.]|nr:hypothetical protein [Marmoricola sp.]
MHVGPRAFDWSLRSCGLNGHVTFRPLEPELAERLSARTAAGTVWRCLRCGTYVPGPPLGTGPARDAPLVLRGRALRDAFILRLLAVERFIRGVLLLALAYGIHRFNGSRDSLQKVFDEYLPTLRPLADKLGIDLQSAGPVRLIDKALHTGHGTLTLVSFGVLAYGGLQLLEGVGLWLIKRWGEYVAVIGTSAFVPLEVYELLERVTWLRLAAFAVNIAAVVYLVWSKRLFGLRGGHAAFEAERHGESLLEVERAALTAPSGTRPTA